MSNQRISDHGYGDRPTQKPAKPTVTPVVNSGASDTDRPRKSRTPKRVKRVVNP